MKNGFKRLVAALLLICTLASFVVPATFADGGSQETVAQSFNFALYNDPAHADIFTANGSLKTKGFTNTCEHCGGKVHECIANRYASLNWKLEVNGFSESSFLSTTDEGLRMRNGDSHWIAFRVNVLSAGTYKLVANKTMSYTYAADVFVLPAPAQTMDAAAVNAAAVAGNNVGQINFTSTQTQDEIGQWTAPAAGEYVIILKNTAASNPRIYINTIDLIGVPQSGSTETTQGGSTETTQSGETLAPGTVAEVYDFVLYDAQNDKGYNAMLGGTTRKFSDDCGCGCGKKFKAHLEEKYEDLGWMVLDYNISSDGNVAFRSDAGWGLRPKGKNCWVALKIKVSQPGTYNVKYTACITTENKAEFHIFSAAELGSGTVANLMASANAAQHSLGEVTTNSSAMSGEFANSWNFTAGEHIVVITLKSSTIAMGKLELIATDSGEVTPTTPSATEPSTTPTTAPTEPSTTPTTPTEPTPPVGGEEIDTTTPGAVVKFYNFTIDAAMGGGRTTIGWSNNCSCGCGKKLREHLSEHYNEYGWEYLNDTTSGNPIFASSIGWSFRLDDDANNGALFLKIDVPAAGTFNLRYSSASVSTTAYKYSAYMLTVDECENGPATGNLEDNKIGSISLIKGTPTATFGSCTFPAAGEYVLMLKLENTNRFYIKSVELVVPGGEEEPDDPSEPTPPEEPLPTECTGTYQEGVYNFALYTDENRAYMFQESGKFVYKELNKSCPVCGKKLRDCIAGQFAENELNWKLENTTFASVAMLADTYASKGYGGMRFRYVYGEDGKILKDETGKEVEEAGNWAAFRVKVNEPGLKRITLYKDNADSSVNADVYIFPASAAAMSAAELEAQITDANKAGEMTFDRVVKELRLGEWNFETAGEYIVLFKTTGSSARFYINGIAIETPTEDPDIPAVDKKVYDFDLSREDPLLDTLGAGSRYNNDKSYRVRAYMQDRYAAGTTDWKFETASTEFGDGGTFREGCFRFKADSDYSISSGSWYSFRLRNPGTATYDIRLVSSGKSNVIANIYLIPTANEMILTEEQVEGLMTKENLLVKQALIEGEDTFYLGEYTFGKEQEYVLVFELLKGNVLYMQEIQMTVDGLVEDSQINIADEEDLIPDYVLPADCTGTYTEGVYNFALYEEDARKYMCVENGKAMSYKDMSKTCVVCGKKLQDCIAAQFAENELNWKIEYTTFASAGLMANTYAESGYGGLCLRYVYGEDGQILKDENGNEVEPVGNYVAFRVKVGSAGTKRITVKKDNPISGVTADMYIFPAAAGTMDKAALEAQITDANKAGQVTFDRVMTELRVGEYNFEAAGEYIIVLKTAGTSKRIYINSIELTVPTPDPDIPITEKKVYNFDLSKDDPLLDTLGAGSRYNNDKSYRVRAYMQDRYAAGTTDWKFEVSSTEFGETGGSFREGCFRFKNNDGYQNVPGSWYSFRIKNPGTATYDIRLVSSGKSKLVADIYLIPAKNEMALTEEQVEAAMTAENLLASSVQMIGEETFYLGEYTFGKNEEYILVFDLKRGTLLHIQEIQMTLDGLVADGTTPKRKVINGTVYDFDLADDMYGIFSDKTVYLADEFDNLERMYKNGSINWAWYDSCDELKGTTLETLNKVGTTVRFYRNTGMRIYGKENYWAAFKIKSPGSGTFTLSLDFAKYSYGGTVAFYIIPGDTPKGEVLKATDSANRVGTVNMTAESNDLEDGACSYIGYCDFEAGKEYILVMEVYEMSPNNSTYCYMNFSQLNMERGKVAFTKEEEKVIRPVTAVEKVLRVADFRGSAAIKEIGGHEYYIMPCEGGNTLVYDLDTEELVDSFGGGFGLPADVYEDSEGMVWITGNSKHLLKYDPYTQVTTTYNWLGQGFGYVEGALDILELDGKMYFGSNHKGILMCMDKETGLFSQVVQLIDGKGDAIRGLTYLNGYLYMSVSSDEGLHVVKVDPATGKEVIVKNLKDVQGKADSIGKLNILGDGELLLAGTYGGLNFAKCLVFDPETLDLVETNLPDCVMSGISEVYNGKQYIAVANGNGLWEYNVETKEFGKTPGMASGGIGFVSRKNVVDLDGKTYLFTASTSAGGNPRLYNIEEGSYSSWDNLVKDGDGGTRLLSIAVGEGDDHGLYLGGFNTHDCVVFDTEKGEITATYRTGGQGDSAIWYNGKLYYGNYSSTTLNEIYPYTGDMNKEPRDNEVIQRWKLDHAETGQKRVLELAAGDGYVFAGTVPDTNQWGGSLTVYNTTNGQWYTHRNIVQDHSIIGLAHSGKLVWAASSFTPGTGTTTEIEQKENAQIVAYDYEKREVVARFDPAKYIPGLLTPVSYIAGLEADPVVENRIWAAVSETVFCFDYDPDTKEFKVREIFSAAKDTYVTSGGRQRSSQDFMFDIERGYVYFCLNTGIGMHRFEIEDMSAPINKLKVKSTKRIMGDLAGEYVIAHDGDLYYIERSGIDLKMLPLNVTDEDWAISGAVDQMILDLGEITLESEVAIKEVRSAYENLKWRYKALVQELDKLLEAETDLLECKIKAAVALEITADSVEPLQVLVDEHKAMLPRYQNYVKNYDKLMEAYNAATALNDERVAKALQARIDALADKFPMTLEIEPEVVAIRTDYDACTPTQRLLVDITLLEKAEAEIAVLRAEFVKYVENLIQAIPEEITLDAEPAITAAREAADKLYATERKLVSYSKLTSAEGKLRALKNAKAAAEEVDALISAIGIVTLGDKERIAAAREAYDALKETALQFVTKAGKLKTAEFILKALQTWGIPAIVIADAGIIFAVLWFVPSLHAKVFKTKKKEEEVIDN